MYFGRSLASIAGCPGKLSKTRITCQALMMLADARHPLPSGSEPSTLRLIPSGFFEDTAEAVLQVEVRIGPKCRPGDLAIFIDDCIDRELDCQGAPPPSLRPGTPREERLRDQLYRGRLLGHRGLYLHLSGLADLSVEGALGAADSATLRFWLASQGHGVQLEFADLDLGVGIQQTPVPLSSLLRETSAPTAATPSGTAAESRHLDSQPEPDSGIQSAPARSELLQTDGPSAQLDVSAEPVEELPEMSSLQFEPSREPEHAQAWREALDSARGAQSWDTLERLFIASYLPLVHLVNDAKASKATLGSVERWGSDFGDCYQSAFARLRSGAPRPTMVLDVPQLTFALQRETEAAQMRLVLVDGMRFDVGQRVHDKLRLQLLGHASCVQRRALWAALPCTTAVQLELLARGACALGRTLGDLDERAWRARGSEARKLRALRVGPHSVRKLDILEAEFGSSAWRSSDLESAASEVAVATARFIKQQAPGTLVAVFGDHGLPPRNHEHLASPEHVIVPYDAWLVHDPIAE
ncbi:MAG TPA: hypothetical protein VHM70_14230 [Polyangiaceae bacterium]|nr:hypothetical protein [Polyangiaceae bacterium]